MENKGIYKNISLEEFENNYWYSIQLKKFLKEIGLKNYGKLRKDEMESIIAKYIKYKEVEVNICKKIENNKIDILDKNEYVENFKNTKETWDFIIKELLKKNSKIKLKSGSKYWVNRWREKQINDGHKIKYKDLINEFYRLNMVEGKLPQIPSTKMNNFLMDYLNNEKGSKRKDAMKEWEILKNLEIKKDYKSWKEYKDVIM
jgi:hypothetical protein